MPFLSWVITFLYVILVLYLARWLYGTWRMRIIDKSPPYRVDPVEQFNEIDRPFIMLAAFAGAAFWPVTLIGFAVWAFLERTPIRSQREMEQELKERKERIAALEKEVMDNNRGRDSTIDDQ